MKKFFIIIIGIIFIVSLIFINFILKKENEKNLLQNGSFSQKKEEENDMKILEVTSENFENEVLKSEKKVLVDFYAQWCGPCQMLSPIVHEFAEENEDIKVVKVNVDESQDIAVKYGIMSIPTLIAFKDGYEINRAVGLIDKEEITSLIK